MITGFCEYIHGWFVNLSLPETFEQEDEYSCGLWATAAVLSYFGRDLNLDFILDLNLTEDGTRQTNILKTLRNRGISANVLYGQPIRKFHKAIDQGKLIMVYDHKDDHWMVLTGYDPDSNDLVIYCPERGMIITTAEEENLNGFGIICNDRLRNIRQAS